MARRNEHSLAEIKVLVLNAAESIIIEDGFSALTIRKIALEMGYTVGSIYMVFDSRADLILHINARTLEEIAAYLKPISETSDIEAWIKSYCQYVRANNHRWHMIFTPHSPENKPLPDWYQVHLNAVFQQFSAYFPAQNTQSINALWQGIQGICLLSTAEELEVSALLLLRIFLNSLSVR